METTYEERMTIQRAQKGDALALARLHDRYYNDIYRYFYFRIGDDAVAEELTAALFVRIVDRIRFFKPEKMSFLSWLYNQAHSEMLEDFLERGQSYQRSVELDNPDAACQPESAALLKRALSALSTDERDVIVGHIIEKRPTKEIAREIGLSVAAVRSLQCQALRKLFSESDLEGTV
jgi:RNA polymerase sigma-70 factor (ECF subfamily)